MQDEVSFDSSRLKTFQNKSKFECIFMHADAMFVNVV